MMNRSALNSIRGSIGMGQGNIRSKDTRSNDMAGTSNYNFSYNNPYGMSKPQGQAFDPMSGGKPGGAPTGKPGGAPTGKPGGAPTGKMFGSSPSDQVSWDNPGLPQSAPNSTLPMGFSGSQPAVPPTPAPSSGLVQGGSFVSPQFQNQPYGQSSYGRQLNRFMGAGGSFDQFRPRQGAQGPQYRNGMSARPWSPPVPPKPTYGGDDGSIVLPPQPVASTSFVAPNFGGGF